MQKILLTAFTAAALVTGGEALAQTYSNAVMALSPAAYWPLQESGGPSSAGYYVATNQGTLGAAGQGYYETWWATNNGTYTLINTNSINHIAGAIAGDSDTALSQGLLGEYVVIPRTTNGVMNAGVTLTAPFTIETWIYPTNASANTLKPIISEGFNNVQATNANYLTTTEGTALGMYSGFVYFVTYSGPSASTKTEIDTVALPLSHWYHVVATFDGTTMSIYTNGVLVRSSTPAKNTFGQTYVPDMVSPLVVGGGNEPGGGGGASDLFGGGIDEVAIYHSALSYTQVTNHYAYGTNVNRTTTYSQVIAGDSPSIYLRLDEPAYTGPIATTAPVASNYGTLGATANGYYLSGATPGVSGPGYVGFGANSAVALNGFDSVIDIGGGSLPATLNRTNGQPVTVTAWFKGNPADCVSRFQTILGHSDSNWRMSLDNNAGVQFNPGSGPQLQFSSVNDELLNGAYVNDGNWHFMAGVSDGTNDSLYIDGLLAKSATGVVNVTNGSPQDVILGGDPQYLVPQPLATGGLNRMFDGSIAQVAVFTNALTGSQIQGIYTAAGVPPSLRQQPASQALDVGTVGSIPTLVVGTSLSYQWYYQGGGAAAGQTSSTLTFNPVTTGSAGSYYLVATNIYGAVTSAVAQVTVFQPGTYSYAVQQLKPVAYWPLNETTQPPSGQYIATNIGTLGAVGQGYYQSWYQPYINGAANTFYATNSIQHIAGPTGDGDTALSCGNVTGAGQYVVIPRFTNGVANQAVTITAPFTIEAWVKSTNFVTSVRGIVTEGRNQNQGGASQSYTNDTYGFSLGQYGGYFFFNVYNGKTLDGKTSGGKEIDVNGIVSNVWYHVVATYDGNTETVYTNGVMAIQASFSGYAPDPISPLLIGTGSDVPASAGCTEFPGAIDDVAIYSSALTQTQATNHYAAAAAGTYKATVLADSPAMYLRLDEPAFSSSSYPNPSTYPVATNYGSIGAVANGYYQPGTAPGVAGPGYSGFAGSGAVAINGFYGAVDIGGGITPPQLNPTGLQQQTVTAWFQGNPADARFQEIVSRGDSSWRLALNGYNTSPSTAIYDLHYNPGANSSDLQFTNINDELANNAMINDGNWHFAAGVSDGTNAYLYIDGTLVKRTNSVASLAGSALDGLIGGSPAHTTPTYNTPNIRYFDGQIAQVAYFTNALSSSQIQQIYGAAGVPLAIVQQPVAALTNNSGTTATLTVGVRGSSPMYQWYSTNVNTGIVTPLGGQTNASLVFNPVSLANAGYYFVVATNVYNAVTSTVAQLVVVGPPVVVQQSAANLKVFVGTAPTIQISVIGPSPAYQWYSNSVSITGATNAAYVLTTNNTSSFSTNNYICVVTNTYGTNSLTIPVAVLADPTAPYPVQVLADKPAHYFRMDEPDDGMGDNGETGYDYAGGYNGSYSNAVLGVTGYSQATDPLETAVQFGLSSSFVNSYLGNVAPYLDYATPVGSNAEFSVEAWVTGYPQTSDAGIVTIGYGFGGEEFNLDTGANETNHAVRFYVNSGTTPGTNFSVKSSFAFNNYGTWHHLVGVCDEAGGHIYLYIDGVLQGSTSIPSGVGLRSQTAPLSIGSRLSTSTATAYDNQFVGNIDDVAIYNYPLSSAQVQAHYLQTGIAPVITGLSPSSNWITNQGANVTLTVSTFGTAPMAYQWLDNNYVPIPWGTNATLVLTNVQPSQAGYYTVNVTNLYSPPGSPASTNLQLTITQLPQIINDITPSSVTTYVATPVTLTVVASGTPPLAYQWYQDGTVVPGATNTSYTFGVLLGTHTYYLSITNIYSAGTPTVSSTATVTGMPGSFLNTNDYSDNMSIKLAGYTRSETLHDFPVLVKLSTNLPGFNYSHFASPSGGDLRFTDSGRTRIIPSEIDEWNSGGVSTVWVQVPALSGTNTTIWAYWGDSSATTPLPGTNVWIPQTWEGLPAYDIVYHLKEGAFPFADSTGQNPALTGVSPAQATGIVGTGSQFDGSTTYLDAGLATLTDPFTMSAWVDAIPFSPVGNGIETLWANQKGGFGSPGFAMFINAYQTTNGDFRIATGGTTGTENGSGAGSITFSQWHLLSVSVSQSNKLATFYVDGVVKGSTGIAGDFPIAGVDLNLGRFTNSSLYFQGTMDEARIHSGLESPNWIWASWMTVQQNSTLENYSPVLSSVISPVAITAKYTSGSGGSLNLSGSGGPINGTFYVIGATNLTTPLLQWAVLSTNSFDGSGNFNVNVSVMTNKPTLFLRIKE